MKRERHKSFKRKPDLLNTVMAVSAGSASTQNNMLIGGGRSRRIRVGSLKRQNSGGKDHHNQLPTVYIDNSKHLLPNSPPARMSDINLR